MNGHLLALRSMQDAIAGERKLLDAGVDVQMVPAPKTLSGAADCGICLKISSADMGKARLLLKNTILEVFENTEDPNVL